MKTFPTFLKRVALCAAVGSAAFFFTGCENMSVGVGVSGYNSASGMSYGVGPYGRW